MKRNSFSVLYFITIIFSLLAITACGGSGESDGDQPDKIGNADAPNDAPVGDPPNNDPDNAPLPDDNTGGDEPDNDPGNTPPPDDNTGGDEPDNDPGNTPPPDDNTGGDQPGNDPGNTNDPPVSIQYNRIVVAGSSPNNPWMKSIADLNGDNLPDLIVSGSVGPIVWYEAPNWNSRVISNNAQSESGSATGDIDGDGDIDLVVGTNWYENQSGNSWLERALPDPSAGDHDIKIADLNGDGKPDIAMRSQSSSTVAVFLQNNKDSWTTFSLNPGVGMNGLALADINSDGRIDIIVGGVWMENPGGDVQLQNWPNYTFTNWHEFASVKVGDIDKDGLVDILLSVSEASGDLSWFKAPPDPRTGSWQGNVIDSGLNNVHNISLVDIDKDGRLDVAASEYEGAGQLSLYLQRDSGWEVKALGADSLHNMQEGDLGNDGDIDFFGVTAFGVNPVIVYENVSVGKSNRILVFSRTLGFRHGAISDGIAAIEQLASDNGFRVDSTEDSSVFTAENLANYAAVVFLNPSGNILNDTQRLAFQQYIQNGGGFVGVHNATAFVLEDWQWYTGLVGARFSSEIDTQSTQLQIVDDSHVSTQNLPAVWNITIESYNFSASPLGNGVTVLVNLDESSVQGGTMGSDHPWSWYQAYDGGRSWYTSGGAESSDYQDSNFLNHLLGGIKYAAEFN